MKKSILLSLTLFTLTTGLFCKSGYVNLVILMAFHPLMSNYNINMDRFFKDIKAESAEDYQKKLQEIKKNVSEELVKANEENKKLLYLIRKESTNIDEAKRFRFQQLTKAREDYENRLKGIKPYEFPKVEFTEEEVDKKKKENIKLTIPKDEEKKELDPVVKASFYEEFRKNSEQIEKTFNKRVLESEKKISELREKIEKGFEYAYRDLLLDKENSNKLVAQVREDISKAVADVAKRKKIDLVLNNTAEFLKDFKPVQNDIFVEKNYYDHEKETMNIINNYNKIINSFSDTHPLSEKSKIQGKNMKKGNPEKYKASDDEQVYLQYENWFETLEKWYGQSIRDYKSMDFNNEMFLLGGTDLTIEVLKELFDLYKISPVLSNDIINYIQAKTQK